MTDDEYEELDMAVLEQRDALRRARGKAKKIEKAKFDELFTKLLDEMVCRGLLVKVGGGYMKLGPLN